MKTVRVSLHGVLNILNILIWNVCFDTSAYAVVNVSKNRSLGNLTESMASIDPVGSKLETNWKSDILEILVIVYHENYTF